MIIASKALAMMITSKTLAMALAESETNVYRRVSFGECADGMDVVVQDDAADHHTLRQSSADELTMNEIQRNDGDTEDHKTIL